MEDNNLKDINIINKKNRIRRINQKLPHFTIKQIQEIINEFESDVRETTINQEEGYRNELLFSIRFSQQDAVKRTKADGEVEGYIKTDVLKSPKQRVLNRVRKYFYLYKSETDGDDYKSKFIFNNQSEYAKQGFSVYECLQSFMNLCTTNNYVNYEVEVVFENENEKVLFLQEREEFLNEYHVLIKSLEEEKKGLSLSVKEYTDSDEKEKKKEAKNLVSYKNAEIKRLKTLEEKIQKIEMKVGE